MLEPNGLWVSGVVALRVLWIFEIQSEGRDSFYARVERPGCEWLRTPPNRRRCGLTRTARNLARIAAASDHQQMRRDADPAEEVRGGPENSSHGKVI